MMFQLNKVASLALIVSLSLPKFVRGSDSEECELNFCKGKWLDKQIRILFAETVDGTNGPETVALHARLCPGCIGALGEIDEQIEEDEVLEKILGRRLDIAREIEKDGVITSTLDSLRWNHAPHGVDGRKLMRKMYQISKRTRDWKREFDICPDVTQLRETRNAPAHTDVSTPKNSKPQSKNSSPTQMMRNNSSAQTKPSPKKNKAPAKQVKPQLLQSAGTRKTSVMQVPIKDVSTARKVSSSICLIRPGLRIRAKKNRTSRSGGFTWNRKFRKGWKGTLGDVFDKKLGKWNVIFDADNKDKNGKMLGKPHATRINVKDFEIIDEAQTARRLLRMAMQ